ncbi:type II toxin-antitoxin system HicB family antitoxin [Streptococcus sp. TATVAM-FAB21]|uniref:type II toxin-antitoxin system HicB family antitoxin n=1 Tax=Streptococcus TaxID=1301 RepID=UPI003980AB89
MMLKAYPAIFHKGINGYWVEFPELAGGTQGGNFEEAMMNAQEFLQAILETHQKEGITWPNLSDMEQISCTDGSVNLVKVEVHENQLKL